MFEKIKEVFKETKALGLLNAEVRDVCPDAGERQRLVGRFREIHKAIECPHNESHILTVAVEMLRFGQKNPNRAGVFVEAGCFKGGSTAKLSVVAKLLNRRLVVFDSFQGIPDNEEEHRKSIFGHSIHEWFAEGSFSGSLEEVRANVERCGEIDVCEFVAGWFDDTLPGLDLEIAGAYIDVDLAASTRTCPPRVQS